MSSSARGGEAALQNHVVFRVPADEKGLLRVAKVSSGNERSDAGHKRRRLLSCDLLGGLELNGHLPVLTQQPWRNPNFGLAERAGNGFIRFSAEGKNGY